MSRWPVHPLLLAAFPVLFLWSRNVGEVFPEDVWPVLGWVLGPTVALLALAALLYRDVRRGALLTSAVALVVLQYGRVASDVPPLVGLPIVLALLAAVATALTGLRGEGLEHTTALANVVGIALVATTVVPLATEAFADEGAPALDELPAAQRVDGAVPDIYYIILDRYGREDSLREVFGYDNSAFTGFLEEHGFVVADASVANYPKTAHSLAASLNMTYLDRLEAEVPADAQDDWGPVYRSLDDHRLGDVLTDLGYRYLHLGTWWSPTSSSRHADEVLTLDPSSEFSQVFRLTTMWPTVRSALGAESARDDREVIAAFSRHQFDVLERLARTDADRPRFVFAHITLPHEPYVFEADGTFVPAEVARSRTRTENFVPQLEYTNARMRDVIEALLADAPPGGEPIVVVQADEGPHPEARVAEGPGYSWLDAPLPELREKLRILNAYHLPGVPDGRIPEDITPVNTWRLVLSTYFGFDLPPLPDRAYVFPDESQLYRFTDVTDRLDG